MLGNMYRSLLIHLIKRSKLFDRAFYLERYGDIVVSVMSPLRHYVTIGDRERRAPMAFFDPDYYRFRVQGRARNVNTLLHYIYVGRYRRVSPSPWFDVDFYLAMNKDVARAGLDPLLHFWKWGGSEGRSPSLEFDSAFYLQTNPVVARLRLNPLLHYLRIGRLEGRSTLPAENNSFTDSGPNQINKHCIPGDDSWNDLTPRTGAESAIVDVIVPVYKGRAETLRCLYSVLSAPCITAFELIVINDASPDAELVADLQRLADRGLFTLVNNPENRGFVYTINRGIGLHQDRDVLLLNADTEVFGDWLDRMLQAANRHPRTGTVTPLSNNATICSYPLFLQNNPFPLELDFAELDSLTATVNAGIEVEAPTGVGFCMYIKRAALVEVGMFDEVAFGRGYGEENDFCQRAIIKGWRNIIAADIFVTHWGMVSFQGETSRRVHAALKTLDRLHPKYQKDVSAFIGRDPLFDVRRRLDRKRLMRLRQNKNILIVCHNRGGGAERHVQEDIRRLTGEGYGVYLMRPMLDQPSHAVFRHSSATQLPNLPACALSDTAAMSEVLKDLGITEMHTHSLVDFAPEAPDLLLALVKGLGISWEVNLHDYKVICPRINLVDSNGYYCGEPSDVVCNKCLCEIGSDFRVIDIDSWRAMHRRVLHAADKVLVPDQDVADRLKRYFPETIFEVSPHEDLELGQTSNRPPELDSDENLRVVIIGAIGKMKGFEVLLACARNARQRRLPIEFILMGYSMNDRLLQEAGVKITGRYLEENAQKTLRKLSPHMVWLPSVWPETYSYTLSIALQAGLPVVAFDIGAIARRIRERLPNAGHRLLSLDFAKQPNILNDRLVEFRLSHIVMDQPQKSLLLPVVLSSSTFYS
jgi:GT2 family glycosyltransferase/glycosyltransferase involved in cell wall biosynthesis